MSEPTSPTLATTLPDPAAAIMELERKMKELESMYLGSSVVASGSNVHGKIPFMPVSSMEKRIQRLKTVLSLPNDSKEIVQSKLPAVPVPTFDGSDLESFLKDWERWLRLSGVQLCSEQVQLDWLVQACAPKANKLATSKVIANHWTLGGKN